MYVIVYLRYTEEHEYVERVVGPFDAEEAAEAFLESTDASEKPTHRNAKGEFQLYPRVESRISKLTPPS